ncbi:MAG: outer membrane beta-barrel protein [Deltaproteobacteria bacterium]|nr:outer membrane beta-barrel protein [Deltaproteobacteria bacterium]
MRQVIAVIAMLAAFAAGTGTAQAKDPDVDIGGSIPLFVPVGKLGDATGVGTGVLAQGAYNVNRTVGLRAQAGFVHHFKNVVSMNVVPIFLGGEFTFGKGGFRPFADLDLCLSVASSTPGGSDTNIGMDVGGGVKYALSKNIDAVGKLGLFVYDLANFTDTMIIGLTAGINFGL